MVQYRVRFPIFVTMFALIAWIVPIGTAVALIANELSMAHLQVGLLGLWILLLVAFSVLNYVVQIFLPAKDGIRDELILTRTIHVAP